jgi:hypothetical protein
MPVIEKKHIPKVMELALTMLYPRMQSHGNQTCGNSKAEQRCDRMAHFPISYSTNAYLDRLSLEIGIPISIMRSQLRVLILLPKYEQEYLSDFKASPANHLKV